MPILFYHRLSCLIPLWHSVGYCFWWNLLFDEHSYGTSLSAFHEQCGLGGGHLHTREWRPCWYSYCWWLYLFQFFYIIKMFFILNHYLLIWLIIFKNLNTLIWSVSLALLYGFNMYYYTLYLFCLVYILFKKKSITYHLTYNLWLIIFIIFLSWYYFDTISSNFTFYLFTMRL